MTGVKHPDLFQPPKPAAAKTAKASTVAGVKSGNLGARYDGKLGAAEGTAENVLPLVELDGVRTVTVQLFNEAGPPRDAVQSVPQPDAEGFARPFTFKEATEDEDPGAGMLRFNVARDQVFASEQPIDFGSNGAFAAVALSGIPRLKLTWATGQATFTVVDAEDLSGYVRLSLELVSQTGSWPADDDDISLVPLTPVPNLELVPNAAARARVRVRAGGTGEEVIECDWAGGFQVNAQSIEIERVSYRPDALADYRDQTVRLAVSLSLDGDAQRFGPQYTVPVEQLGYNAARTILVPQHARRVSLLCKYGSGSPTGDAALALWFIAFKLPHVGSMGFIDCLSARSALFGEGLPIPHGCNAVVLTNESGDPIELGAIFHLGL